ncbi:ral GTPase-activating protein subunit beta isoform X13 [Drosophila guanche]|uniref:Blast:Ral GTPase-activating protein subunit beta n=1 Tax=Drosophila guanche TaxID=7266 RepID=A0A3B0JW29_DROGU|nr:ral GTPase-activating protein subunit beta isoform X13 [Drosophila guanche]SPP77929.1 blast:Ral GTPase-activating protein subunit beta [Drosophila guanche]
MYSEWASLSAQITANSCGAQCFSVLNKFPASAGREVVVSVVKQLGTNLGITQNAEPSHLVKDEEVKWCMDVICFGLSLPLQEHETIKDCVNVYCEWLTALHPQPRISVPKPICEDANLYARQIINHFHNLFVPRQGESADTIKRQAVLCHRVLRTLQQTAQISQLMDRQTWDTLLLFLLAINEILLAPPTVKDDVGDQLCERVLSVLFEVWLLACVRSFPSPSMWKTLQESCSMWRHRVALVDQWNRVNLALTSRLLEFSYGPAFPQLKNADEDGQLIPVGMSNDCVAQTWYRFLRMIGNPTALCSPHIISKSSHFVQWALTHEKGAETHQHPCLQQLPQIFLNAMKGISSQVDAFLGLSKTSLIGLTGGGARNAIGSSSNSSNSNNNSYTHSSSSTSAGPVQGSGGGGGGAAVASGIGTGIGPGSGSGSGSGTGGQAPTPVSAAAAPTTPTSTSGPPSASSSINSLPLTTMGAGTELAVARPKCNSILHVFHEWLFEAAHIGGDTWRQNRKKQACEASKRPSSMIMEHRKGSISLSQPNSLNDPASLPPTLTIDKYESGRAEAIGTLCKIFCAKKTGEEILPVYLARFYMALQQCLKITESKECDETLASILLHSGDLFRLDLDGINVLLPGFIAALEIVLPDKDLKLKTQSMAFNRTELRRSAINILLSIMVLPLHYQALPIRDLSSETSEKMFTFIQLKSRLMNILMNALQVETDAQNTHMLLGGLLLCVQDAVTFEETDMGGTASTHMHNSGGAQHHEANLLSSACSERSASLVSTGTASLGAQTTATMGAGSGSMRDTASAHDYPSLTISDDMSFEFGQELEGVTTYDNAHALFVRATYLVCHRLISSWKTDLNVSLAALELLSGLARLHIRETDALECKRAVKWICDYICYQCSRPPPAHSKDLHSTIVAAFQCTAAWLMQHPYLLQDKDCLQTVLEVVELGISGTKSQSKSGDIPKFKDEKELKPASMRVRDAAENLLTIILEQVGYFPSECGPESISSLLDELALMKHCNSMVPAAAASTEQAIAKFKYFVTENSTILALLEEPLGNDQDPQPTVTLLIRGPFGRHAWTMQLRHLPRSKSGIKYHAINPGRPIPMNDVSQRPECEQKNFPDGVDKVQPCVADYSIPTIDQIREQYGSASIRELEALLENQSIHEKLAWAEADNSVDSLSHSQECVPPLVCQEFHAARLFLSHFGFLTFETRNPHNPAEALGTPPQRPLIVLDTKSTAFAADLDRLDKLSARTHDTVYVFYVKTGQTSAQQIIGNMIEETSHTYDPHFAGMLQTLGWPVLVADHSGWTGFAHNSWSLKGTPEEQQQQQQQQLQLKSNVPSELNYNGSQRVLYWADVSAEIAFVVPTTWNLRYNSDTSDGGSLSGSDQLGTSNVWARCESEAGTGAAKSKPRNLSLELDTSTGTGTGTGRSQKDPVPPTRRKGNVTKPTLLAQAPAKIFLVWLESYEDYLNFPLEDLLAYTRTGEELHSLQQPRAADCHVIFVHSLLSGLLRVKLQGPPGRMSFATPLVDGMVLSRRVVGNLVRQTALNISRRRRLDNDNYQPPHVRRRLKVQDIVQKYKMDLSEAELLAHLFQRAI